MGMNKAEFCRNIGYEPSQYGNMFSRGDAPNLGLAQKIVKSTSVNSAWLLTGEGEMLRNEGAEEEESAANVKSAERLISALGITIEALHATIDVQKVAMESLARERDQLAAELEQRVAGFGTEREGESEFKDK